MKVNPSNQTLILATDRRRAGDKSSTTLDRVFSAASNGGSLKRVTIVASQPDDSVLYLQADYAGGDTDSAIPAAAPARTALIPQGYGSRDDHGNSRSKVSDVGLSSYLKPVEQYAQIQRTSSAAPRTSYIDVLA